MAEFVEGFEFLAPLRREVTIFGSSEFTEASLWYKEAQHFGKLLGENGFTVITGGGPGIMEAANRGAAEAEKFSADDRRRRTGDAGDDGNRLTTADENRLRHRHIFDL